MSYFYYELLLCILSALLFFFVNFCTFTSLRGVQLACSSASCPPPPLFFFSLFFLFFSFYEDLTLLFIICTPYACAKPVVNLLNNPSSPFTLIVKLWLLTYLLLSANSRRSDVVRFPLPLLAITQPPSPWLWPPLSTNESVCIVAGPHPRKDTNARYLVSTAYYFFWWYSARFSPPLF